MECLIINLLYYGEVASRHGARVDRQEERGQEEGKERGVESETSGEEVSDGAHSYQVLEEEEEEEEESKTVCQSTDTGAVEDGLIAPPTATHPLNTKEAAEGDTIEEEVAMPPPSSGKAAEIDTIEEELVPLTATPPPSSGETAEGDTIEEGKVTPPPPSSIEAAEGSTIEEGKVAPPPPSSIEAAEGSTMEEGEVAPPTAMPPPSSGEVAEGDTTQAQTDVSRQSPSSDMEGKPLEEEGAGQKKLTEEEAESEAVTQADSLDGPGKVSQVAAATESEEQATSTDQQSLEHFPSSHVVLLKPKSFASLMKALKVTKGATPTPDQLANPWDLEPQKPPKPKPTKKLSKHSLAGTKYAPGDYSNIPVYFQKTGTSSGMEGASGGDATPLSYQSFIISNSVDARLQYSLELPAELSLQCMARTVYESVLVAVLNTRPLPPLCPLLVGLGGEKEEDVPLCPGPAKQSSAMMLCHSIEQLLERAIVPKSDVNIVSVLELWNELNSVVTEPLPEESGSGATAPLLGEKPGTDIEVEVRKKKEIYLGDWREDVSLSPLAGLPICTQRAINLLLDTLLSPSPSSSSSSPSSSSPSSSSSKTWRLGLVLLHTAVRHYSGREIPVDWEKLLAVLVAVFSNGVYTADAQDEVVPSLLVDLIPAKVGRSKLDGMGREERTGIHLLLEVLISVLENG